MTPPQALLLGIMTLVFVLWAFWLFRTMFEIQRRARHATGKHMVGPAATLREWRHWLSAPEDRTARRQVGITTLALLIWIISQAIRAG